MNYAVTIENTVKRTITADASFSTEKEAFEHLKDCIFDYEYDTYSNLDYPNYEDLTLELAKEHFGLQIPLDDVTIGIHELTDEQAEKYVFERVSYKEFCSEVL